MTCSFCLSHQAYAQVPLCVGTTIVTAVSQPEGDYESIKTITSVSDKDFSIRYSTERPVNGALRKVKIQRRVLLADMIEAPLYMHYFDASGAITIPGTTAIGTSRAVLRSLKATGKADLGIFEAIASGAPTDPKAHPNVYDYKMVEKIQRVGTGRIMLPLIVNDVPAQLPAIEARADYTGDKADFYFLDDDTNPLALRYRIGKDALDVVKISYNCPRTTGAAAAMSRIERSLLETGRVDVYSIYFSFNSDQVREESDSTLREIGEIMRRHPDWKLAIDGHTDNIGGDSYNLDLSQRRAAAVKTALTSRHAVEAKRVTTAGFGRSRPKDTNDTLEGRARNRRVELVRS